MHAGDELHILESSQQRLQLCFKPHLNLKFTQEIMVFQNGRSLNFGNFGTPNLGILTQNDIWM
jgi:hypothetical protein